MNRPDREAVLLETAASLPETGAAYADAGLGDRLRAYVRAAAHKARELQRPVLAWASSRIPRVDPIALFDLAKDAPGERMLLASPDASLSLVGVGRAWELAAAGGGRFRQAGVAAQALLAAAVGDDGGVLVRGPAGGDAALAGWGAGPVVMGGFSFDPGGPADPQWHGFPAGSLILPGLCVAATADATWLTVATMVGPDGSPERDPGDAVAGGLGLVVAAREMVAAARDGDNAPAGRAPGAVLQKPEIEEIPSGACWREAVAAAARDVRGGVLRKVVLARTLRVRGRTFDPVATLRRLRDGYPGCTLFAVARGDRCFLGATPERLVRVRVGEVRAMALAGTAPRGRDADEDRRLGERLLANPKERLEHAVVVEVLREALAGVTDALSAAGDPGLLGLANVQHLCTPLTARLRERLTVLDLVDRLHPTPAVGGVPPALALDWIRRHEGMDRGWYAGPVGWMDRAGEGEFAVAIRSALLRRDEALLFAGCGIVADSDPDQEYAESRLKLRPMLSALGINGEAG